MDFQTLFAPFQNHDLCLWFYFLSIIGFVFLAIAIISGLYLGLTSKKTNSSFYFSLLFVCSWYLIFYFQNRLLYTMCVKSV